MPFQTLLCRKSVTCLAEPTHALLLSFSAYTNGKKIIRVSEQSDQILFFNGLKVISMFWVIVGHRYQIASNIVINKADATEVYELFPFLVLC